MKTKFLLIISIGLLLFAACEPNQDIYDEYDALQKPYYENLEITLTDADYTSLKKYALAIAETITADELPNPRESGISF